MCFWFLFHLVILISCGLHIVISFENFIVILKGAREGVHWPLEPFYVDESIIDMFMTYQLIGSCV